VGTPDAIATHQFPSHINKEIGKMSDFYETWKGIAHKLQRSERWCRYTARRAHDPLPVFKVGGIVRLNEIDLTEWLARQRDTSIASPSVSVPPGLKLIA
jgi:hypothetical protein